MSECQRKEWPYPQRGGPINHKWLTALRCIRFMNVVAEITNADGLLGPHRGVRSANLVRVLSTIGCRNIRSRHGSLTIAQHALSFIHEDVDESVKSAP